MKNNLIFKIIIVMLTIILITLIILIVLKSNSIKNESSNNFLDTKWKLIKVEYDEDGKIYNDSSFSTINLNFDKEYVNVCITIEDNQCYNTKYSYNGNSCNVEKLDLVDISGEGTIEEGILKFSMDRGLAKAIYYFERED